MSGKDTHLIPCNLALAVGSLMMLVKQANAIMLFCCPLGITELHLHYLTLPIYCQQQEVINIFSTTISCSLFGLKFNQK